MRTRISGVSLAAILAVAALLPACQTSNGDTTPLQPTVVEPPRSTKTFPGTVAVNGQTNLNFTTVQNGTVDVALTAAGPPSTIVMRIGLGQPSSGDPTQCQVSNVFVDTAASATPQLSVPVAAGTYCLAIRDVPAAVRTEVVSFTFTVTAPFGS